MKRANPPIHIHSKDNMMKTFIKTPAQIVRCPEGSTWDGKGCWAKNLKAVSR